jgi:hypothetical protein
LGEGDILILKEADMEHKDRQRLERIERELKSIVRTLKGKDFKRLIQAAIEEMDRQS